MIRNKQQEASLICDAVMLKVGQWTPRGANWIKGEHAVTEMKDAGFGSWKEVEWPGFYARYALHSAITQGTFAGFEPIAERKHYMAKGTYLWDVRVMEEDSTAVWWADKTRLDELIRSNDGIGLVLFMAFYVKDYSGTFRRWHTNLGGGRSDWVRDRIARGASPRTRKTEFSVSMAIALFLNPADIIQGDQQGWLTEYAQDMRNQDGELRNPKYMLHLDEMPIDKLVGVRNFNMEPDEFESMYGDLQQI